MMHVSEQPSYENGFASSHSWGARTRPSPHVGPHTLGPGSAGTVQLEYGSISQTAEQPSAPVLFPSSHCSGYCTTPSPHSSNVQALALSASGRAQLAPGSIAQIALQPSPSI